MKNVRIYKDDIRIHILRSLFFTDTVLVVLSSMIITLVLFLVFRFILHFFNWTYFISSAIIADIFFVTFITQRVDNQPIYKVAARAVSFKKSKKQNRYKDIEPYFTDFTIQDGHIYRKNNITRMYEIEPYDIALLNDQDREHFFSKLKQVIQILPIRIQFIVRKERSNLKDYSRHFFSLYKSSNLRTESHIKKYAQDLCNLIEEESVFITRHYAILSVPCRLSNIQHRVEAINKLNDVGLRFAAGLHQSNISVRPLENDELVSFVQATLR